MVLSLRNKKFKNKIQQNLTSIKALLKLMIHSFNYILNIITQATAYKIEPIANS